MSGDTANLSLGELAHRLGLTVHLVAVSPADPKFAPLLFSRTTEIDGKDTMFRFEHEVITSERIQLAGRLDGLMYRPDVGHVLYVTTGIYRKPAFDHIPCVASGKLCRVVYRTLIRCKAAPFAQVILPHYKEVTLG